MNSGFAGQRALRATLAVLLGTLTLLAPSGVPLANDTSHLSRLMWLLVASLPWMLVVYMLLRRPQFGHLVGRILSVAVIVLATRFGMHQLGTYDVSSIVDLSWRYEQGQSPFQDFPLTLPPTFASTIRASWVLLGHDWSSLVRGSALVTIGLTVVAWRALSKSGFGSAVNELLISCALAIPHLAIGHLWHSALSSQLAVVTALCLLAWAKEPTRGSCSFLGFFLALLALSKPNVAAPMLIVSVVWIFRYWRSRNAGMLIGSFAVTGTVVFLVSRTNPIDVWITNVELLSSRSKPVQLLPSGLDDFGQFFFVGSYVVLLVTLVFVLVTLLVNFRRGISLTLSTIFLGVGCLLAALAGMATNWDIKSSDMPLAIVGLLLLAWSPRAKDNVKRPSAPSRVVPVLAVAALTVMNFSIGSTRWRMELTGPMTQPEPTAVLQGRVLDGVHAAPLLQAVDQQLSQALAESSNRTVFLGPRLEIFYARFGLDSPKGLPLWWHEGTSYTTRDKKGIISAFSAANFPRAIFFKQDFTRFPPELRAILDRDFTIDERYSQLTIFWAKTE
ncbi:MAG: hypothetical protein EBU84_01925 [Actinobacteria bacterium]|nr:hypothetical protein [Actinomycetota bacterium]